MIAVRKVLAPSENLGTSLVTGVLGNTDGILVSRARLPGTSLKVSAFDVGFVFGRPLLVDLTSSLHSDSILFLGRKTTQRRSRLQV
jgi:hypothetical protein